MTTITATRTRYGIRRTLPVSYEDALVRTREALAREGFGVIAEIDIAAKLKEKLGVDFHRYMILGACVPRLAHRALEAEPDIGLLLPCNVIVYEAGAETVVAAIDAGAMLAVTGNDQLSEIADEVRARLERVIDSL